MRRSSFPTFCPLPCHVSRAPISVAASSTAQTLGFLMFAVDQTLWWDQSFSVNIAELDHQHQRLFRTVAELSYAVRTGRANSIINEVLEKVIQHTISHFAAEELLLQ